MTPVSRCFIVGLIGFGLRAVTVLAARPALLFVSPGPGGEGRLDLQYLAELHDHGDGFEVDYTTSLNEVTWQRITNYNALVLYGTPDGVAVQFRKENPSAERSEAFVRLMERYVEAGGGIFLHIGDHNTRKQLASDLTERWGAKLPLEMIVETNAHRMATLSHGAYPVPLYFTDVIENSPLTTNVTQIWYPPHRYKAQYCGPIEVDSNWKVIVRGSPTSRTEPYVQDDNATGIPDPYYRPDPSLPPDLFAVRSLRSGRVALTWQVWSYTIGSGTRWIFNRECLDGVVQGRTNHFGRLLRNTYAWLCEPSLGGGRLGGYVMPPGRLDPPNAAERVRRRYREMYPPYAYDTNALTKVALSPHHIIYKGLIGARSVYSSGTGTVADYAAAAQDAALDFVVFLEDLDGIDSNRWAQLKADCKTHSTDDLLLLPGFRCWNNIGNRMFFFGPDAVLPPASVLCGPRASTIYIQEENESGGFTGRSTPFLGWVLSTYATGPTYGQCGYYDFSGSPNGMRMHDLRLFSAVGLRTYRNGRLVEDVTDAYLTTAHGAMPAVPMSINEVTSPAELMAEVAEGHSLTCVRAGSLDAGANGGVFRQRLGWSGQNQTPLVFVSDGPVVQAWTGLEWGAHGCHRADTYGGENFVRGADIMESPICVTSGVGLAEIRLYNGRDLFRRFRCDGAPTFERNLLLSGTVQKTLTLIADDVKGGRAVCFPRICRKDGSLAPSFLTDHVNSYVGQLLFARGPFELPFNHAPDLHENVAGHSWDGGPPAYMPVAAVQQTTPTYSTGGVSVRAYDLDVVPVVEVSDEGVVVLRTERHEAYSDRLDAVLNPWHTFGPVAGLSPYLEHVQRYCQYVQPTVGVPDMGWASPSVWSGGNASLLVNTTRFRSAQHVAWFRIGSLDCTRGGVLVVSTNGVTTAYDLPAQRGTMSVGRGDWWALFNPTRVANAQIFFNRGDPIDLRCWGEHISLFAPDLADAEVAAGDSYRSAIAAIGLPVTISVTNVAAVQAYVDYLASPDGMLIPRGRRIASPGLVALTPEDYGVELFVPSSSRDLTFTLPVRISGMNHKWSAGLWQKQGYCKGFYGSGTNRYRSLGIDAEGCAHLPLHVDYAPRTHIVAGHPIVADGEGTNLFVEVLNVGGWNTNSWHIAVNNPTDRAVTTTLRRAMDLPGLVFERRAVTVPAGGYRIIANASPEDAP